MEKKNFKDSAWDSKIVEELESFGLQGLEISDVNLSEKAAKKMALSDVFECVDKVFDEYRCWVISGHAVWQKNSRVTRYKKFFSAAGISVPAELVELKEWEVSSDEGIKFFAIIDKSAVSDDEFLRLCKRLETTWLVFSKNPEDRKIIPELLSNGWLSSSYVCPRDLLSLAHTLNMMLARDFGPMDDGCAGAVLIGEGGVIDRLLAPQLRSNTL